MKNILMRNGLIINPKNCEILTDELSYKIVDEDAGIDITAKNEVKYLGQKINPEGIEEQIIDDKLFVCVKNKLSKLSFLSPLTRIRIFKVYMISKINNLLPIITLNGLLSLS